MIATLTRHANGEAKVIPIILRHVYWHGEPLGKLNAFPTDGKPVAGVVSDGPARTQRTAGPHATTGSPMTSRRQNVTRW